MTPDSERIRRIVVLLMVLVAGCVDAIGFVHEEIFPANMTGNAVLLAVALGGSLPLDHAKLPTLVLFSFCGGIALGSLLTSSLKAYLSNSFNLVIFLSGLAISWCGFSLLRTPAHFSIHHLLIIATAMGMQSSAAVALNVSGAGITTVITSTLTVAISKIMESLYAVFSSRKAKDLPATVFPILVFFMYAAGAFLGVFHWKLPLSLVILIAGMLLVVASVVSALSFRNFTNYEVNAL